MSCDTWIEALSAAADGEDPGVDPRLVAAHLTRCEPCRAFATELEGVDVASRVAVVPAAPDLARQVARSAAVADRARVSGVLRALLGGIAIAVGVSSIPPLIFGDDGMGMGMSHAARHFGAFSMAYAVGLLVVTVRPARARTMLPVAFVVASALAVTAVFDAAEGRVTFIAEGRHIPELVSLALVWLLTRANVAAGAVAPHTTVPLRLVEHDISPDQREVG
jgi:predicted anti-sigma-YlaC factor YlaD